MQQELFSGMKNLLIPLFAVILLLCAVIAVRSALSKNKRKRTKKRGLRREIKQYSKSYLEKSGLKNAKVSDKGTYGEFLIYDTLSKLVSEDSLFPNVYIETRDSEITEIDLIHLNERCLIIIEIKNYAGAVSGREQEKYWIHRLAGNSTKFYNPVRQNHGHCIAVKNLFPFIPKDRIVSLIVFSNRCLLNVDCPSIVITSDHLSERMKAIKAAHPRFFTPDQMKLIRKGLLQRSRQDVSVRRRHIRQVKRKQAQSR